MPERLFEGIAVADFIQQRIQSALSDAAALPDAVLLSDRLDRSIDTIVKKHSVEVARLTPEKKTGKRRTIKRMVNDYGSLIEKSSDVIYVSIPFSGLQESFSLSPDYCKFIGDRADVSTTALSITLADDEKLEPAVEEFVGIVSDNLDRIRSNLATLDQQVRDAVEKATDARLGRARELQERDSRRSFPIK